MKTKSTCEIVKPIAVRKEDECKWELRKNFWSKLGVIYGAYSVFIGKRKVGDGGSITLHLKTDSRRPDIKPFDHYIPSMSARPKKIVDLTCAETLSGKEIVSHSSQKRSAEAVASLVEKAARDWAEFGKNQKK